MRASWRQCLQQCVRSIRRCRRVQVDESSFAAINQFLRKTVASRQGKQLLRFMWSSRAVSFQAYVGYFSLGSVSMLCRNIPGANFDHQRVESTFSWMKSVPHFSFLKLGMITFSRFKADFPFCYLKTKEMKYFLTFLALLSLTALAPSQVVSVMADGADTFTTADMHSIENTLGNPIQSVTIDLSPVAGAFWDMDGVTNFGNAPDPVIGDTNYTGIVTWTYDAAYPQPLSITANFDPCLEPCEYIRFGADTDFFKSDPCPGGNFAGGCATVTVQQCVGFASFLTYNSVDGDTAATGVHLEITGTCPGAVTVTVSNVTPGGSVAIVFSAGGRGLFNVPPGNPCSGALLCLDPLGLALGGVFVTGASGSVTVGPVTVPPPPCGSAIQALDLTSCIPSNVKIL